MKKFFVSAGIVAAGAAGLQSAMADSVDIVSPKAWNVSATLRGFYDDNYNIANTKKGSFGVELSPSISYNLPLQQTDLGLRYTYGLYYYQDRDAAGLNAFDQSHQLDLWLDHSFTERWKATISDTLAIGQEPELIGPVSPSTPNGVLYRVSGDNLANHATVSLHTEWTRQFSTLLSYGNGFYNYQNSGITLQNGTTGLPPIWLGPNPASSQAGFHSLSGTGGASLEGALGRVEQNVALDFQWHIQPETLGFIGYNFSWVNYVGGEPVGVFNYYDMSLSPRSVVYKSDSRDSLSHYLYVGVSHQFTANLSGSVKVGATYTDSYNDPLQTSTSWSPYADFSVSYTYIPGSYVQIGFTHDINATDVAQVNMANGSLTLHQESSVIYADLNHRFNPKLLGTIIGRCQYSTFNGGPEQDQSDTAYSLGINFRYQFTSHFSGDIGYNFDDLISGIGGREYVRNRVYLGVAANY